MRINHLSQRRDQTRCGPFSISSNIWLLGVKRICHWASPSFFVINHTLHRTNIFLVIQYLSVSEKRYSATQKQPIVIILPVVYLISTCAKKTEKAHCTKVANFHQPITLSKNVEAKESKLPYTRVHCNFQSTSSCNIACVNSLHENESYMRKTERVRR